MSDFRDTAADAIARAIVRNKRCPWSVRCRAQALEEAKRKCWTKWTIAKLRVAFQDSLAEHADELQAICTENE